MPDSSAMNWVRAALIALLPVCSNLAAQNQPVEEAIEPQPAIHAPLADESLLLDVIRYNGGYVAVGSRGHVLLSEDGSEWRQAQSVPVQAALTRITSHGRRLWAVGHDATIVSSIDGGETWRIQHFDPQAQEPLLDVLFINASEGFAIGAYGRFMTTIDGGINWQMERLTDRVTSEAIDWAAIARRQGDVETIPDEFQDPDTGDPEADVNKGCYEFGECHLNAILQTGPDSLIIAAERGYGFRSADEGETWEAFRFPYDGSMFGLVQQRGCVVAFGLRGHIQRSCDFGSNWDQIPSGSEASLMGGAVRDNGVAVLVGAAATRAMLSPDGEVSIESDLLGADYAAVAIAEGGDLILVGENGVSHE